jgi:putative endonuclease
MFYVYAFYDNTKKVFYVGYTNDLKRRVKEHKIGKTQTTSKMADKLLVYYEACLSKKDAMEREKQLKTGFGRGYLKRRLKNYLTGA